MTTTSQAEEFTIQPTNPADLGELQDLLTRSFSSQGLLSSQISNSQQTPELQAFLATARKIRQQNNIQGRYNPGRTSIGGKLIHNPSGEIVGLVMLLSPRDATCETPTLELIAYHSPADKATLPAGAEDMLAKWRAADEEFESYSSAILGAEAERNEKWWTLHILAVRPDFQRRGLGGLLVRWAVGVVGDDIQQRRQKRKMVGRSTRAMSGIDADARDDVKGVWLIAAQAGLRTYLREGFVAMGERWVGGGGGETGGGETGGGETGGGETGGGETGGGETGEDDSAIDAEMQKTEQVNQGKKFTWCVLEI